MNAYLVQILSGIAGILTGVVLQIIAYRLLDGEWFLLELWRARCNDKE